MKRKKDFIPPDTIVAISLFAVQSIFKAILGWIGLETFKNIWRKINLWWQKKN
jgi:hypothetical protein